MSSKYTERLQIGLTYEQMEFVQSKSWDSNQAMSQYIRRPAPDIPLDPPRATVTEEVRKQLEG